MFRKHTLLAATVILAATMTTSLAESDRLIAAKQGSSPTCEAICGSICSISSTQEASATTLQSCNSTCKAFCSVSGSCNPTVFPQQAAFSTPSRMQLASPGHDYTTQSVLMQEQMMMNLLNQDRKVNGLEPLAFDEELSRIARIKSADMRDEGYFAHESPTYGNVRAMLKHFGYPYAGAGENIAHHANVDKAQAAFMSSPGHRANILSRAWTKVGIGIVFDRQGYIYATQIFAR